MRSFSVRGLLLAVAGLLAGCCANDTCDCQDSLADALSLRFELARAAPPADTAFQPHEVRTVTLYRYDTAAVAPGTSIAYDSVIISRPASQAGAAIILRSGAPFAVVGTRRLNSFRYVVRVQDSVRQALKLPPRDFRLDSIQLRGDFVADGCCTCYRNQSKSVRVNGQKVAAETVNNQPLLVMLKK